MKIKSARIHAFPIMIVAAAFSQNAPSKSAVAAPDTAAIAGVWRADMDGLPYVTLDITNETGSLSGAVLFYLHRRDPGQPVISSAGIPEPLLNPKFDGTALTFQVSHRHAHPPGSLNDPPVNFHFKLIGGDKGALVNKTEGSLELVLARTEY